MKTIEEKAEEYISGYGDGYAPKGIDISQDPYSEERGFTLKDGKQIFIDGAKWATSNLWINTKDELPFNNYINKLVKNTTLYVLCIDKNGYIWLDKMIKLKNEGWLWANTSEQPIAWMPIPDLKI